MIDPPRSPRVLLPRLRRGLDLLLATGTVLCATAMLSVVTVQIVCRFALPRAPAWTEEAARYLFIYMISFAAALGVKERAYVGFDALVQGLRGRWQVALQLFLQLVVVALMGVVLWQSLAFVRVGGFQTTATLGLRMSYIHASIGLMSATTLLYAAAEAGHHLVQLIRPGLAAGTNDDSG